MSKVKSKSFPPAQAEIRGVRYNLAPLNLHIREKITELSQLSEMVDKGEMTVKKFYKTLIKFVSLASKCKVFEEMKLENIDLNELEVAVTNIIDAYNAQKVQNREATKKLLEMGDKLVQSASKIN